VCFFSEEMYFYEDLCVGKVHLQFLHYFSEDVFHQGEVCSLAVFESGTFCLDYGIYSATYLEYIILIKYISCNFELCIDQMILEFLCFKFWFEFKLNE
jgi:hypothetical protein